MEENRALASQPPQHRKGGRQWTENRRVLEGILWILRSGARWQDLNRVLEPARKALGLPLLSWHDLRHTLASWLGLAGAMPKDVQAVLGHSNIEMAMHYTHTSPDAVRAVMERATAGIWAQLGTNGHNGPETVN